MAEAAQIGIHSNFATKISNSLRNQLQDRRIRLEEGLTASPGDLRLSELLNEVDNALTRIENGTYGVCDGCHLSIEPQRLTANPILRFCLDCLTPEQQRALERDLELASRVQGQLLPPKQVRIGGWSACFHYEAFGHVSGDYCDLVPAGGDVLYFVLGDVAGKGIAASMLMAQLRAIFRTLITLGLPPAAMLQQANNIFCNTATDIHYATVVCGRAHPDGSIQLANGGHCKPLLVQRGGVTTLESTGFPLGMFYDSTFGTLSLSVAPGDGLLLYTDGVSEACDHLGAEYGAERVRDAAGRYREFEPQEVIQGCLDDLASFLKDAGRDDDLSMLAVARTITS